MRVAMQTQAGANTDLLVAGAVDCTDWSISTHIGTIAPIGEISSWNIRSPSRRTRASSAEMAKTARLNSKRFRRPAARPIRELRYAKKVLRA